MIESYDVEVKIRITVVADSPEQAVSSANSIVEFEAPYKEFTAFWPEGHRPLYTRVIDQRMYDIDC